MRCPKCSLIVSNKKDICPQCLQDLRPAKKELGLPVSAPDAAYEQLRGDALSVKSTTSPEVPAPRTTQAAPQKKSWVKRLFGKDADQPPVQAAAPLITQPPAQPTTKAETPAPERKTEAKAPQAAPQPVKAAPLKEEPAPEPKKKTLDEALLNLSFEEDPLRPDTDNGLDKIEPMIAPDDSLFHLPDVEAAPERPAPAPRPAPSAGGLQLVSEDAAEDDLDKLFAKINEACVTKDSGEEEEEGDDLFLLKEPDQDARKQKANHPAPAILDFQNDESLMNEKLDELLGEDIIDVKAVKAAAKAPQPRTDDEDLEISFEVDLDGDEDEELEDDEDVLEAKLASEMAEEAGEEIAAADTEDDPAADGEDLLDALITVVSKLLDIPEGEALDPEKLLALAAKAGTLKAKEAEEAATKPVPAAQGIEADDLWVDYLIEDSALEAMNSWHAAEEAYNESLIEESWQAGTMPQEAYFHEPVPSTESEAGPAADQFTAEEAPGCELKVAPAAKEPASTGIGSAAAAAAKSGAGMAISSSGNGCTAGSSSGCSFSSVV